MKIKPGLGESGPFDVTSVMIYAFPPRFYAKGEASTCFAKETSSLSEGDMAGLRKLFPKDVAAAEAVRRAALDEYLKKLNALPGIAEDRKSLAIGRAAKISGESLPAWGESTIMLGHVPND